MTLRFAAAAIAAGALVVMAADPAGAQVVSDLCGAGDIVITKATMRGPDKYGQLHLTGILTHQCAKALGIQLKWTTYAADGSVLFSFDFWPASVGNIAPGHAFPFDVPGDQVGTAVRFTVEPIAARAW